MGLLSTASGLASYITTFIDPNELASTVTGLGSASFVSTLQLTLNIRSTVGGLGSSGYVSSLTFVTLMSSQQITVSSLGINCNSPAYQLDVAGNVRANFMSSPQIITSSFYGSLADAFTVIVYDM
jgi:hypothetical protein